MSKKSFDERIAIQQALNARTAKKQDVQLWARQLAHKIDAGELSDQALALVAQAVSLAVGKPVVPGHGIDLRPFQAVLDSEKNLEYLNSRARNFRLLSAGELSVRDFIDWGLLPAHEKKFEQYLRSFGRIPLRTLLSMRRAQHYPHAHSQHLTIDEQFLDDLDVMFLHVFGFGLETQQSIIIDECDIQVGHLKAAIRMTKQFSA